MSVRQFNKILVYVPASHQGADPAIERAARLARAQGAEVTVATVMGEVDEELGKSLNLNLDLRQIIHDQIHKRLQDAVSPLQKEGLAFTTRLLQGSPVVELVREALAGGYQLLLKTSRPSEDNHGIRFSSLALQLTRKCPCAVWIVQPDDQGPARRVLAAVEPGPDPQKDLLDRKVLDLARSVAECDNAELHVLHVWSAYGEGVLRSHLSQDEVEAYAEACRAQAESRLQRLLDVALPGQEKPQVHLRKGEPGRMIPEFAQEEGIQLLVMGSVARSGVSGLLMGNTAERTIRRIHCSLLTVKPDGFVSPVETAQGG